MAPASSGKTRPKTRLDRLAATRSWWNRPSSSARRWRCARVGGAGEEGFPAEEEDEQLEAVAAFGLGEREEAIVVAGEIENGREVDFEELLGDGPGSLIVQPPARAVRQDAPAKLSGGQVVHTPEIAEHLGRGRGPLLLVPGAAVDGPEPALGLDHRDPERVTPPLLPESVGPILRSVVGEQQPVGNVAPAPGV